MRLTSEFWVSHLIRRTFNDGGYAAIARKGAVEAGSIFVRSRARNGLTDLYGPAPQTVYDNEKPQDRAFVLLLEKANDETIDAKLDRELKFDSDLWVVEVELGKTGLNEMIDIKTL